MAEVLVANRGRAGGRVSRQTVADAPGKTAGLRHLDSASYRRAFTARLWRSILLVAIGKVVVVLVVCLYLGVTIQLGTVWAVIPRFTLDVEVDQLITLLQIGTWAALFFAAIAIAWAELDRHHFRSWAEDDLAWSAGEPPVVAYNHWVLTERSDGIRAGAWLGIVVLPATVTLEWALYRWHSDLDIPPPSPIVLALCAAIVASAFAVINRQRRAVTDPTPFAALLGDTDCVASPSPIV